MNIDHTKKKHFIEHFRCWKLFLKEPVRHTLSCSNFNKICTKDKIRGSSCELQPLAQNFGDTLVPARAKVVNRNAAEWE